MTWTYRQHTGALSHNGVFISSGYSGHDSGLNNPAAETVRGVGPIPHGRYRIGSPHNSPNVGPFAMALDALPGTDTHGRSAFLMHGDNRAANHTASHGCIIMPRTVREQVWDSGDDTLEVVA